MRTVHRRNFSLATDELVLELGRMLDKIKAQIPPRLFSRYLVVGIWNTVFGYGVYAGLTAVLTPRIPHAYIAASVIGNVLAITEAFLAYKWLVFRTKGNYLKEWMRCVAVYGGAAVLSIVLLPGVVFALRQEAGLAASAPYVAGALLLGLTVIISFLGHKNFSFAVRGTVRN
jgi:putative flippase GtrA